MPVQTQILHRRGTAATWTSTNPTLGAGEIGFETDTGKFKFGDGSTAWASLAYYPTLGANTFTGAQTATRFIVTGSTVATNGIYLPAANTLGLSTDSAERMRIGSTGNVGVGLSNPTSLLHISGTSSPTLTVDLYGDNTTGAGIATRKARGTSTSPTAVLSGDNLGAILGRGYGDTGFGSANVAAIIFVADGNFTDASQPTYMTFGTTPNGSTSRSERMRITSDGNIGVGTAGTTLSRFNVGGTFTTSSNVSQAIRISGTLPSTLTGTASSIVSVPSTQAASFTLSNLYHFQAAQGTIGAGSAITTQIGYLVGSDMTGATNNYGFYSDLSAATGRYNFIATGTAVNYFAGRVGIGAIITSGVMAQVTNTTAADVGLIVRGAASQTGDLLQIQNSAGAVLTKIDSSGNIGWNTSPTAPIDVAGAGSTNTNIRVRNNDGITDLYTLNGGNTYLVNQTTGKSILFATQNTERMRIDSSGNVGIGTTSPTAKLDVNGSINSNNMLTGNPVLNSAMQIWQRGTSISVTAGTGGYSADRWYYAVGANQAATISRQTTSDTTNLPFIQYCLRYQRNSGQTGTGNMTLQQSFESINAIPYAGKTVTLSFYARRGANFSPTSNLLIVGFYSGTGTDQNFQSGYTGTANIVDTTQALTTTWARYSFTGSVASTATEFALLFGMSATGTAGAADYFEITGVQIDVGSVALPFRTNAATLAGELSACQRYYYRASATGAYTPYGFGQSETTSTVYAVVQMAVPMRTRPTTLEYADLAVYDGTTVTGTPTSVALTTANSSNDRVWLLFTKSSPFTANRFYTLLSNNSTSAYVGLSAEL